MDKYKVGLVRPLPRWAEATQRRSLAEAGIERVVNLASEPVDDVLIGIRMRDTVAVYHLHVLADRGLAGIHPRTSLFWWMRALVDRRAIIVETATGRRADLSQIGDYPLLLDMVADAVEVITRGTRGAAAARKVARENGALGGRASFDPTRNRAVVEELHYRSAGEQGYVPDGLEYRKRLRRLGWSRAKAYEILGPRKGR